LRLLAWRAGKNFQSGFQRIIGFDQLQFCRTAAEQVGEKPLKLGVDHIKGGNQAFTPLAIKVLNARTQLAYRIDDVVAFLDERRKLLRQLRLFLFSTQVDRPKPFALDL